MLILSRDEIILNILFPVGRFPLEKLKISAKTIKTLRRIFLLVLLVIPITMILVSFSQSPVDEGLELAYTVIGIPILVVNMWEWFMPLIKE